MTEPAGPAVSLAALGWSEQLAASMPARECLVPARVRSVYATRVDVLTESGPRHGIVRGRALRQAMELGGIAVGDWVAIGETMQDSARTPAAADEVVVEAILPRRTVFMRQAAGERAEPQAIAANIDVVLVVTSLDGDFNERRLERYLLAIRSGGADALVLLNKADLLVGTEAEIATASHLAETLLVSARTGQGIDAVRARIGPGVTAALAGSSGVGKSALVNALLGRDAQREGAVREHDKRGRHTTTKRSLFLLDTGGLLVDTPGMRELKPWQPEATDDDDDVFADVAALAASCRYRDCRHEGEPGCAVEEGARTGALAPERLAAYRKLVSERQELASRQAQHATEQKRRERSASLFVKKRAREKGR